MNNSLLDPHQRFELPTSIEEVLREGQARCAAFNRLGTLLAVGCEEGLIIIYDFETRGVVKRLTWTRAKIQSIAWGKDGHHCAAVSADSAAALLKVTTGTVVANLGLPSQAYKISISSADPTICLASCANGPAQLLNFGSGVCRPTPTDANDGDGKNKASSSAKTIGEAIFDTTGLYAFVTQARSTIAVLTTQTFCHASTAKVPGMARVLGLALDRKGKHLLVNCSDRVLRLYSVQPTSTDDSQGAAVVGQRHPPRLQLKREFSNAIERTSWRAAAFTGNGEHMSAASSNASEHAIYIWDRAFGRLEMVLQGPKESVLDMAWHPVRSLLVTITSTGAVYIWARVYRENWAAFAPDFEELHDNYEYEEQEDEFDIQHPAPDLNQGTASSQEDEMVDIDAIDHDHPISDDDDDTCLHHLTVEIRPDKPLAAKVKEDERDQITPSNNQNGNGSIASNDEDDQQTAGSIITLQPSSSFGPPAEDAAGRRHRAARAKSLALHREELDCSDLVQQMPDAKRRNLKI